MAGPPEEMPTSIAAILPPGGYTQGMRDAILSLIAALIALAGWGLCVLSLVIDSLAGSLIGAFVALALPLVFLKTTRPA